MNTEYINSLKMIRFSIHSKNSIFFHNKETKK